MNSLKKTIAGFAIAGTLALGVAMPTTTTAGDDDVAAIMLSMYFPGGGEWYNSGFSGGFPIVECILGAICPCVRISSLLDAAAGRTDDGIRFDFWGSPNK